MIDDSEAAMYVKAYHGVQRVLDRALGPRVEDGAGEGIVADVALLAQRYVDLKEALRADPLLGSAWDSTINEIELRPLRRGFRPWNEVKAEAQPIREPDGTVSIYSPVPRSETS